MSKLILAKEKSFFTCYWLALATINPVDRAKVTTNLAESSTGAFLVVQCVKPNKTKVMAPHKSRKKWNMAREEHILVENRTF